MRHGLTLGLALMILWGGCAAAFLSPPARAQSAAPGKPKLKDFGSSLKRLKWDQEKKAAVEVSGGKEKGGDGGEDEVVRVQTTLVVCDVLALDRQGRSVRGLTRDDFVVTEDGQPQAIDTFTLGDNATAPRSIVLIIDYSGSQLPFIKTSVEAAKTLVDRLGPRDTMALVTDDVELLVDFTRDKAQLKKALESLKKKATNNGFVPRRFGRSAQYSALMATLNELFDEEDLRPIVIFQTDGDEAPSLRHSPVRPFAPPLPPGMSAERLKALEKAREAMLREFSLADVYKAAERSRATVYSIIPGVQLIGLAPGQEREKLKALRDHFARSYTSPRSAYSSAVFEESLRYWAEQGPNMQMALLALSKVTGGWIDFLEDPSQAETVYERIFSDMNRRYVIGYYPTNKERDGKRRKVNIEVRGHPEYVVWGRKSYYAPGPEE